MGVIEATDKQTHSAVACLDMGEVQPQRVAQNVYCCQDGVRVVQGFPHAHEDNVGDGGCSRHSSWSSGKLQQGHGARRMPPYCAGASSCPKMAVVCPAAHCRRQGGAGTMRGQQATAAAGAYE